jgi:hypothetical protein
MHDQVDEDTNDGQRVFLFFRLPLAIRRIFDRFPLNILPANSLPRRSPQSRDVNVLHVFTTVAAAANDAPSFNPACLKWQVSDRVLPNDAALTCCRRTSSFLVFRSRPFRRATTRPRLAFCHTCPRQSLLPRSHRPNLLHVTRSWVGSTLGLV